MAWTTPRTWVANEIVRAATLNEQVRDNLTALRDESAQVPATAAGVQWVAANGADTNTGLSWGTAKATIQAAHDALPSGGGTIHVGSGSFAPFTISKGNVTVQGSGRLVTNVQMTSTAGQVGITMSAVHAVIRDIGVLGSVAGGGGVESHGIQISDAAHHCILENFRVRDVAGNGVHSVGNVGPQIDMGWIVDTGGYGVYLGRRADDSLRTHHANITRNWIQSTTKSGIYSDRSESPNITGNILEVCGGTGYAGLEMFETIAPNVVGNYFEDNLDDDIRYDDTAGFAVDGYIAHNKFFKFATSPTHCIYIKKAFRFQLDRNYFVPTNVNVRVDSGSTLGFITGQRYAGTTSIAAGTMQWEINPGAITALSGPLPVLDIVDNSDTATLKRLRFRVDQAGGTARIDSTVASGSPMPIVLTLGGTEYLRVDSVALTIAGRLLFGATGPQVRAGSGTPEGAITAFVGSLYLRTDGGAGTSLYVKESGTGNTGWVAK